MDSTFKEFQIDKKESPLYISLIADKNQLQIDPSLVVGEQQCFAEEIKCPVCLNLVFDPVECKNCNHVFCRKCSNQWTNKNKTSIYGGMVFGDPIRPISEIRSNESLSSYLSITNYSNPFLSRSSISENRSNLTCPMRCPRFQETPINTRFKNMIYKIKIKCPNVIKGCNYIISYEDIAKHLQICEYNEFMCAGLDCGFKSTKKEIEIHTKFCALIPVDCQDCSQKIIRISMLDHSEICPNRKVICRICNSFVKLTELNTSHRQYDCIFKVMIQYEKNSPNANLFANVYTTQEMQFNNENVESVMHSIIEKKGQNEFFLYEEKISGVYFKNIVTIIELTKDLDLNNMDLGLDYRSAELKIKLYVSAEGSKWEEMLSSKITKKFNFHNSDFNVSSIVIPTIKGKFILVVGDKPFKIKYFKINN